MGNAATTPLDDAALAGSAARLADQGSVDEVAAGLAPRLAAATDNSIYQVRPAMIPHPREGADLNRIVRAADSPEAMLATGFSCRYQTRRLAGHRPRRPVEAILERLESTEA